MKIYSIRDNDIGSYNLPFYNKTDVEAIRNTTMSVEKGLLKEFPASFALYLLGEFNESDGTFTNIKEPKLIIPISQILESKKTSEAIRDSIK